MSIARCRGYLHARAPRRRHYRFAVDSRHSHDSRGMVTVAGYRVRHLMHTKAGVDRRHHFSHRLTPRNGQLRRSACWVVARRRPKAGGRIAVASVEIGTPPEEAPTYATHNLRMPGRPACQEVPWSPGDVLPGVAGARHPVVHKRSHPTCRTPCVVHIKLRRPVTLLPGPGTLVRRVTDHERTMQERAAGCRREPQYHQQGCIIVKVGDGHRC
jgi:hypothetical protein